jgi:hypothetical protein
VLDLASALRLVAVGGGALLLVRAGFDAWANPTPRTLFVGAGAVLVGALAFVVDAAQVATSPGYEATLAGRSVAPPFRPFARRAGGR